MLKELEAAVCRVREEALLAERARALAAMRRIWEICRDPLGAGSGLWQVQRDFDEIRMLVRPFLRD